MYAREGMATLQPDDQSALVAARHYVSQHTLDAVYLNDHQTLVL